MVIKILTNTFPVDVKQNELPSEEMYMSGKSLYALSMSVAQKLAKDFDGKLRISYSGGADYFNITKIIELVSACNYGNYHVKARRL